MQSEFLFSWKIMAKNIELVWMISKAFYARQHESKYKLMSSIHNLICSIEKKTNRIYKLSDIFPFSVRTYSSWTFYYTSHKIWHAICAYSFMNSVCWPLMHGKPNKQRQLYQMKMKFNKWYAIIMAYRFEK